MDFSENPIRKSLDLEKSKLLCGRTDGVGTSA